MQSPVLRVTRLTPTDWPVLKATRLAALREAPHAFTSRYDVEVAKPDAAWQQMAAANASDETSAGFLAYEGVNPVGLLAAVWQDKAQGLVRLVSLWVSPASRHQGVASQLVENALGWARAVGALAGEAEVTEENHPAEVFYWRRGFRRVPASRKGISRWLRNVGEAQVPAWPGEDEAVRLVESDPGWPAKFEDERRRLTPALSPWLVGTVEHVGSTSVPGLLAKPIVDVAARVFSLEASCAAIPVLEGLGYLYAPYRARQHWFCKPSPAHREFHLTLLERSDAEWARRLAFRNLLRADAAVARAYTEVKQDAARQYATDREAYTQAKSRFVDAVSEEALGLGYFQAETSGA